MKNCKTFYDTQTAFYDRLKQIIQSFIFWSKYRFFGTAVGRFSQCFFLFFVVGQSWWPIFQPLTIKKHPTAIKGDVPVEHIVLQLFRLMIFNSF